MTTDDPVDCDNAPYCIAQSGEIRKLKAQIEDLIDLVQECVSQGCTVENGELDSMAISTYRDALLVLEAEGRVEVDLRAGRRIIAHWKEADDGSS